CPLGGSRTLTNAVLPRKRIACPRAGSGPQPRPSAFAPTLRAPSIRAAVSRMKTLYKRLVYATPSHPNVALLLLRLWFGGALALAHGLPKLGKLERFVDSVAGHGVPLPTLSAGFAVTSELIGGLLLALGLFTRA